MKTLQKILLSGLVIFFSSSAIAQSSTSFSSIYLNDSLTSASDKNDDGYYYNSFPINYVSGSRLYVQFAAFGTNNHDLIVTFTDEKNKTVRYAEMMVNGMTTAKVEVDTTFNSDGRVIMNFTTKKPGQKLRYLAEAHFATPAALKCSDTASFCTKLFFILKHSDNAYRFISKTKTGDSRQTTTPISSSYPDQNTIEWELGKLTYKSVVKKTTQSSATDYLTQIEKTLRACCGKDAEFKTENSSSGLPVLTCTIKAPTQGVNIRNGRYSMKIEDTMIKYKIEIAVLKKGTDPMQSHEVHMTISNLFVQY